MSNPVDAKWFSSAMNGAPSLTGAIGGGIIAVLDAFLVNGFGSVTLNSLVVSSGVATATVNTGHGFLDYQVVLIAGATPSGLNGDKRINYISSTQFSFDATGIADGAATGTITAKTSPLGWTKEFSGTNKAVYAKQSGGTPHVLRVDDTAANYAALNMYETMSGIDTGVNPLPSSGSLWLYKSTDTSTAREWRTYGDAFAFYLAAKTTGSNYYGRMFFGDILSEVTGDNYHCALIATTENKAESYLNNISKNTAGHYIARAWDQITPGPAIGKTAGYLAASFTGGWAGGGPFQWPNLSNKRMTLEPIRVWEPTTSRGEMPGLYNHANSSALQFAVIFGEDDFAGRRFVAQPLWAVSASVDQTMMIDITGPWR